MKIAHPMVIKISFCKGEYVAQFKFTVLLMPNGPIRSEDVLSHFSHSSLAGNVHVKTYLFNIPIPRITQGPAFDLETVESEYSITDESIKVCCLCLSVFGCFTL